ncbi:MAG TPA: M20/M25/M40 family metallo-hydrolase [Methylomirabilota bacterium]|jgi:acetylornithine deacetylase|nr:M20/M25/M40 family metallo-hydrolase [Methylomirabilota bacterium]
MTATLKDRILEAIDPGEVIDLAKELVRIPSYTTEETPVARYLDDVFRREGLESRLQEVDPGRFQTIARLPGAGGGRSLMLNGHIDIDPIPGGWIRDPWTPTIEGDRLYGAGIYNMKGGVTAMVMAAVAARRARLPLRGDVLVACVVGELQGGVGTVHLLRSGVRADLGIVPEPYGTGNIVTKHTGVVEFAVHVIGRSAHISRMEHGVNAISKMTRVVHALEGLRFRGEPDPDLPGLPRLLVGSIMGGRGREWEIRGPNLVPDVCTIFVDVRFPESMTPQSVLEDVRRALDGAAAADPTLRYEIEFPMRPERRAMREVMPAMTMPPDHPLVQTLRANVRRIVGVDPRIGAILPRSYAGNDTAHLFNAGIPCCLYGPAGEHEETSADRWTPVSQIVDCTRVLAATLVDLAA